jgi:DNA-binding IclR family transcriptional regulator
MMLAHLTWEEVEDILRERAPGRRKSGDAGPAARQLVRAGGSGGATCYAEERLPGVMCVGASVRDSTGSVVVAVSTWGRRGSDATACPLAAEQVITIAEQGSTIGGAPADEAVNQRSFSLHAPHSSVNRGRS